MSGRRAKRMRREVRKQLENSMTLSDVFPPKRPSAIYVLHYGENHRSVGHLIALTSRTLTVEQAQQWADEQLGQHGPMIGWNNVSSDPSAQYTIDALSTTHYILRRHLDMWQLVAVIYRIDGHGPSNKEMASYWGTEILNGRLRVSVGWLGTVPSTRDGFTTICGYGPRPKKNIQTGWDHGNRAVLDTRNPDLYPVHADDTTTLNEAKKTEVTARAILSSNPHFGAPGVLNNKEIGVSILGGDLDGDPLEEAVPVMLLEPPKVFMITGKNESGPSLEMQVEAICHAGFNRTSPVVSIFSTLADWELVADEGMVELRDGEGGLWADGNPQLDKEWLSAAQSQKWVTVLYGVGIGAYVSSGTDHERGEMLRSAKSMGLVAAAMIPWTRYS